MTPAQERKLENVERLLKILIADRKPEWISEDEAMLILQRGKCWLKFQRNGNGQTPATLAKGKDWRYINGRTPEYKMKSIQALKDLLSIKEPRRRKLQMS